MPEPGFREGCRFICTMARTISFVPVSHVDMYANIIPQASVRRLAGRDHQLNEDLSEVASDIVGIKLTA